MGNACVDKMHSVILDIIKPNDLGHPYVIEHVYILLRMLPIPMLRVPVLDWAHERHELAGNDPIEVAVFDALVVLVFLHVERAEVVPSKAHGVLKALQAVEEGAVVEALALGSISVVAENGVVGLKLGVCVLCLHLEDDYHERTHQEGAIYDFVSRIGRRAVMEDSIL